MENQAPGSISLKSTHRPTIGITSEADDEQLVFLNDLREEIEKGPLDNIKAKINVLREKLLSENNLFTSLYTKFEHCITQNDLIYAACHNKSDVLCYILQETPILHHLNNPNMKEEDIDAQKKKIFRLALCKRSDFRMVELLYDYWCNKMHWAGYKESKRNFSNNVKRIGKILCAISKECDLKDKQNDLIALHCLNQFNKFQFKLYTELEKLDTHKEPSRVIAMQHILQTVISIYIEYSDLDKVRIKDKCPKKETALIELLTDENYLSTRAQFYLTYEVYFRKLDYNVSLLILDNLNFLKNELVSTENDLKLFQDIECNIYYFIYRNNEDWRLYFPKDRSMTDARILCYYDNGFTYRDVKIDEHKTINGAILFLEREAFVKGINKLNEINKIKPNSIKTCAEELNTIIDKYDYLNSTNKTYSYLSDNYSINKVVRCVENVIGNNGGFDKTSVLVVERAIQIIGEMLKNNPKTRHLSDTTIALLQVEFSIETVKHLRTLRNNLSKTYEEKITRRIDAAKKNVNIYYEVQNDLKNMIHGLKTVQTIYKPVVDRALIEQGIRVLNEKIKTMPEEATIRINSSSNYVTEGPHFENDFFEKNWKHLGLKRELLREVTWVVTIKQKLEKKKQDIDDYINEETTKLLLKYTVLVDRILERIKDNIKIWNKVRYLISYYIYPKKHKQKCIYLNPNDYIKAEIPKKNELNRVILKLKSINKNKNDSKIESLIKEIELIEDYSNHWTCVINLLRFYTNEVSEYREIYTVNNNDWISKLHELPETDRINIVQDFIDKIKTDTKQVKSLIQQHSFNGIRELINISLTNVNNNESNITKRDKLIVCLTNRIAFLKIILQYDMNVDRSLQKNTLVMRYNWDQRFRMCVEMLLADIFNIFTSCGLYDISEKQYNLLAGRDLGNVLDHGDIFLEIIGDILDNLDFSSELMSRALTIAEHEESIGALYKLFKDNINAETIKKGDVNNMTEEQKDSLELFKTCVNWKEYLKLIKVYVNTPTTSSANKK